MKVISRNELGHPDMVELEELEQQAYYEFFDKVDELHELSKPIQEAKLEALNLIRILYASLDSYGNREFWGWLMVTTRG